MKLSYTKTVIIGISVCRSSIVLALGWGGTTERLSKHWISIDDCKPIALCQMVWEINEYFISFSFSGYNDSICLSKPNTTF